MWYAWGRRKCMVFWWGTLKKRDHLDDVSVDGLVKSGRLL
jgi:hypothetical protein